MNITINMKVVVMESRRNKSNIEKEVKSKIEKEMKSKIEVYQFKTVKMLTSLFSFCRASRT